jgi:hypothetical protein
MPFGIAEALMVIGSGTEAFGNLQAGSASAVSLRKQAKMTQMEGREAKRLSDYRVRLIHQEGAELLGSIQAETGKSGLAMTGTPLQSLVDNARQIELSAALEKRSGTITQLRYEQQADALKQEAKNAKKSGAFGAIGALTSLGAML